MTSSKSRVEKFRENVNAYNKKQESEANTRIDNAFKKIMSMMGEESEYGKIEICVVFSILGILPEDKERLVKRILAEGLTWTRTHLHQCNCDQTVAEGCGPFIRIGFSMSKI